MKYYKVKEVAEMLSVTRQCIDKWRKQGRIKAIKIGKAVRISEEEIERLKRGE